MKRYIQGLVTAVVAASAMWGASAHALDVTKYPVGTQIDHATAEQLFKDYNARPKQPWAEPKEADIPAGPDGDQIRWGLKLTRDSSSTMGPRQPDVAMRHSRNDLNCSSCHQAGPSGLPGTKPYSLPWTNTVNDYPKLDPKSMKVTSLEQRIAGMLGAGETKILLDSPEMKAMVAYITWLGSTSKPGHAMEGTGLDESIVMPHRAADPVNGKGLFAEKCAMCHGEQGLGKPKEGFSTGAGYEYPPIAGDDAYDDSGHMYMVPLLTRFLHTNMPYGATKETPILTVDEAYDIAAYVNSALPRKHNANRTGLYPDPAFRLEGFAIPENFPGDDAAYQRGRFGPYTSAHP